MSVGEYGMLEKEKVLVVGWGGKVITLGRPSGEKAEGFEDMRRI